MLSVPVPSGPHVIKKKDAEKKKKRAKSARHPISNLAIFLPFYLENVLGTH